MRTRYKIAAIGIPLVSSLAVLAALGTSFAPVSRGSSAEFWEYACGVQLPGFDGHLKGAYWGGIHPPVDGLIYYFTQSHHRQHLYDVLPGEVAADLRQVRSALRAETDPSETGPCRTGDRKKCELYERGADKRLACRDLLDEPVTDASIGEIVSRIHDSHLRAGEFGAIDDREARGLRDRLERARRAWLSVAFEALFLSGWILFTAWPWLRNRSFNRQVLHLGLSPFLLFLPYFLGYAPMTLTFGPSGGFLYPAYLFFASLPVGVVPCSLLDEVLWKALPPLLAPLTQLPGNPAAASSFRCVGPFTALAFGAIFAATLVAGRQLVRARRRRRTRAAVGSPDR